MIPFIKPDVDVKNIVKLINRAQKKEIDKLEDYFRELTEKKYILFTSSARSSLYLAYKALNKKGEVISSPLTCEISLLPIICTGNEIHFVDVNPDTLNIDVNKVDGAINDKTIAIQAIHIAGNPCDMIALRQIAEKSDLIIIEDCAQAFGSRYNDKPIGYYGDIACYNLSKNLFGLSGGIFATNEKCYYEKAKSIQNKFQNTNKRLYYFRAIKYILATYRNYSIINFLYNKLMGLRKLDSNSKLLFSENKGCTYLLSTIKKPTENDAKYINYQIQKYDNFQNIRLAKVRELTHHITNIKSITPQVIQDKSISSYCRYMVRLDRDIREILSAFVDSGVEVKHLQQEYGSSFQDNLGKNENFKESKGLRECSNYFKIHNKILSLPISHRLSSKEISIIIGVLKKLSNLEKNEDLV